jgi:crotonobetainyl-CoA:carnitine CoA-transferase CaiB-like acyl-CoA transferase
MTGGPLAGILVVAIEQAVAAPFATRHLADLGARVIKVERPDGDFARGYDRTVRGMASYFAWLNRSKESLELDLTTPAGSSALRKLVARADVLVQNLGPGAVDRLGFGPEAARALNPRLVYLSVSGYGSPGPYRDRKAYDLLVQCEAGLLSVTGTPETTVKVGVSVADIAAGMYAYTGVLSGLLQRARTGRGVTLEVSMLEALGEWMSQPYLYGTYGGTSPPRSGAAHATIAPYGPFTCADEPVFLAIQNEREWREFCRTVLRRPDLVDDARFTDNAGRVAHRPDLHAAIAPVLAGMTAAQARARLDGAGIANAVLRDVRGFAQHPQLRARGRWHDVPSPAGPVRMLLPPVDSDAWDHRVDAIPRLGEHTEAILRELGEGTDHGTVG